MKPLQWAPSEDAFIRTPGGESQIISAGLLRYRVSITGMNTCLQRYSLFQSEVNVHLYKHVLLLMCDKEAKANEKISKKNTKTYRAI